MRQIIISKIKLKFAATCETFNSLLHTFFAYYVKATNFGVISGVHGFIPEVDKFARHYLNRFARNISYFKFKPCVVVCLLTN